jgi:hypothetical protein
LRKRWFSAELNGLFQKELKRESEYLKKNPTDKPYFGDGFPFTPYEECSKGGREIKNVLKIAAVTQRGNKTLVEVQFFTPKACGGDFIDTYKVELIKMKGVWLLNDWIAGDGGRLTDALKRTGDW